MASTAAAIGAGTRARQADQQARRRAELQRQRERRRARAAKIFDATTSDRLSEAQLSDFLKRVMGVNTLDTNALQLVIDTINGHEEQKKSASSSGKGFVREAVLDALEKYGEYVKHAKMVNEMYNKFDKDKDGGLSRREFGRALEAYERNANRAGKKSGVVVHLVVTDADLDLILEKADANKDGEISRNEVLPALAAWEELAEIKLEKQDMCCVIL